MISWDRLFEKEKEKEIRKNLRVTTVYY